MLLHFINLSNESKFSSRKQRDNRSSNVVHLVADFEDNIANSCKMVANSYGLFKSKAKEQVSGASFCIHFLSLHQVSAEVSDFGLLTFKL